MCGVVSVCVSLKKKICGASFELAFGREKICSLSAGQTQQTLVLSQPRHKLVFKASRLAAPQSWGAGWRGEGVQHLAEKVCFGSRAWNL